MSIASTNFSGSTKESSQVLIELNSHYASFPLYAYVLSALRREMGGGDVVAYSVGDQESLITKLMFRLREKKRVGKFLFYDSIGTSRYLVPKKSRKLIKDADEILAGALKDGSSKEKLLGLTVNGIHIGDLVYDKVLRNFRVGTFNAGSHEAKSIAAYMIRQFLFWHEYFSLAKVSAVICSHTVYNQGIVPRIATSLNIPVYEIPDANVIRRLDKAHPYPGHETAQYRSLFKSMSAEEQKLALDLGREILTRRLSGGGGQMLSREAAKNFSRHSTEEKVFSDTSRKRVVIFCHHFFDAPHISGLAIYPDQWEWLAALHKFAKNTDYDWYLKLHPDGKDANRLVLQKLKRDFSHFTIIPQTTNHRQMIKEGISSVFTVYGSVGSEYPYFGVLVVNASSTNPHRAYTFNVHPENHGDLEKAVRNLSTLNLPDVHNELFEYHFMAGAFFSEDIFYRNFNQVVSPIGYSDPLGPLKIWLEDWNPQKNKILEKAVENFISSGDSRLYWRHYGWGRPSEPLTGESILGRVK